MIAPLVSSLDAVASPTAATPVADGSASNPFSALIQGLQPVADSLAGTVPGGTGPTAQSMLSQSGLQSLPETMLADNKDPLTSALVSMLQALGLSSDSSEPALASQDGIDTDSVADTPASDAPSNVNASPMLPTVPMLIANAPALPASTVLASAMSASGRPADADLALNAASGSPVQVQARQWLAASVPDTTALVQQPESQKPGAQILAAQALPVASAMPAGNAWLQQPLTTFFSMNTRAESSPLITDRIGLLPDSSAVPADMPKGLPAALSFAQTLSSASSTSAPVLTTLLPHAVQDPAWSDAFGQRVALLAQQGTQSATLQLNPPDLGPVQVRIVLSEQGAKVEFTTLQQTTSDLIENAMPRLAAALEHQGLRLDDSRVHLATTRQDVFNAPSAFSSARQDTPQGERGQPMPQHSQASSRMASASAEAEAARPLGTVIQLPGAEKAGIDYYA